MRLLIVNYFCIKEVLFRNKKIREQLTGNSWQKMRPAFGRCAW